MANTKLHFEYLGSKFWIIVWALIFFPVALVLLGTAARFSGNGSVYTVSYGGSRMWLGFWTLVCFPVAFLLLLLNGVALDCDDGR